MKSFDTIIIGSGISGMTAGIILAQEGQKVLVLEQHTKPGGLMQSYEREGSTFPTGVHRLGSLGEGEILWRYFKYLNVFDKLKLKPLEKKGFEEFRFPGMTFKVPYGHDFFKKSLYKHFPMEKTAIDRYFSDMEKTVSQYFLYNIAKESAEKKSGINLNPLGSYLEELGCSKELTCILTGNNPLYAIKPSECPVSTHFFVTDSFLNSSWRVDENKTTLPQTFVNSLVDCGGEIICGALVKSITCTDRKVTGVILETGEQLLANRIIFTGHPSRIIDMCPPKSFKPAFINRINDSENTAGFFGIAVQWNNLDCPLLSCDAYIYSSWDTEKVYEKPLFSGEQKPGVIYCSAVEGKSGESCSVTALVGASIKDTIYLEKLRSTKNSEYLSAKKLMAAYILGELKKQWPEMAEEMKIIDIYTPCTFNRYTLTPNGAAYGVKKSVAKYLNSSFHTRTKVEGLFLSGQSLLLPGILGALISSVLTCTEILGKDYLLNKIRAVH
jgi:all-trans-retinol 13,14-reductase